MEAHFIFTEGYKNISWGKTYSKRMPNIQV